MFISKLIMSDILPNKKLADWRNAKGISHRALAEEIIAFAKADASAPPEYFKINHTDIRRAENHLSKASYKRVTDAIYSYYDVSEGFFGDFADPLKKYATEIETLHVLEAQVIYQTQNIVSLEKLVETQRLLIEKLQAENKALTQKLEKG